MAIFKIQSQNLVELKSKTFPTERELQLLVDANLDKIFGLEFIKREFGGQGLSIDTIAYDPETKSPVLIEYKKDTYQSVIDQGMAYLNWLLTHKGNYQVALEGKLGKREIDWSQPRVIFIARSFNIHQIYASGFKNAPFELYRYDLCNDVLLLEPVETPKSDVSIASVLKTREVEKVTQQIKAYTINDHIARSNNSIKVLFEKFRKSIFALDERIQEKAVKNYVGYKIRFYNFCTIHFYKDKLKIYVRKTKIEDPQKLFNKVPKEWRWGKTPLWYLDLSSEEYFDYVFGVIKETYQAAPDI